MSTADVRTIVVTTALAEPLSGFAETADLGALATKDTAATADIDDSAVTNAKLAHMAQATVKGRAAGAGTGIVTDLTGAQLRAIANVEDGAQANAVASVAGKTGDVTLEKADVGLGNVDNTSDANKPVSTATQTALDETAVIVAAVEERVEPIVSTDHPLYAFFAALSGTIGVGLRRSDLAWEMVSAIIRDTAYLPGGVEARKVAIPGKYMPAFDSAGRILSYYDDAGLFHTIGDTAVIAPRPTGFRSGINMAIVYGQSWARGTGGYPVITSSARFGTLRFVGGVRPDNTSSDPGVIFASLVSANETATLDNGRGETPASGFVESIMELASARTGADEEDLGVQWLICSPGQSAASLALLEKGTSQYQFMMDCISAGALRAAELGEPFTVPVITLQLGKGDYDDGEVDRAAIATRIIRLREHIDADIKAIVADASGDVGHPDVLLVVEGTGSHSHATRQPNFDLALMDAADEDANIIWGGSQWVFPRAVDNVHYTATSYKLIGASMGVEAEHMLMTGEKLAPLKMLSGVRVGEESILDVQFNPRTGPMVLDTSPGDPGDYGFEVYEAVEADGEYDVTGSPLTIDTVAPVGLQAVRLTGTGWPVGPLIVRLAWDQAADPSRACVRDSSAFVFDPAGLNTTIRNFARLGQIVIGA